MYSYLILETMVKLVIPLIFGLIGSLIELSIANLESTTGDIKFLVSNLNIMVDDETRFFQKILWFYTNLFGFMTLMIVIEGIQILIITKTPKNYRFNQNLVLKLLIYPIFFAGISALSAMKGLNQTNFLSENQVAVLSNRNLASTPTIKKFVTKLADVPRTTKQMETSGYFCDEKLCYISYYNCLYSIDTTFMSSINSQKIQATYKDCFSAYTLVRVGAGYYYSIEYINKGWGDDRWTLIQYVDSPFSYREIQYYLSPDSLMKSQDDYNVFTTKNPNFCAVRLDGSTSCLAIGAMGIKIVITSTIVYVAGSNGFINIISYSSDNNPISIVKQFYCPSNGAAYNSKTKKLYLASDYDVTVWDLSDPVNPNKVNTFQASGLHSMFIYSDGLTLLAYSGNTTTNINTYDLTDLNNVVLLDSYPISDGIGFYLVQSTGNLFFGNSYSSVTLISYPPKAIAELSYTQLILGPQTIQLKFYKLYSGATNYIVGDFIIKSITTTNLESTASWISFNAISGVMTVLPSNTNLVGEIFLYVFFIEKLTPNDFYFSPTQSIASNEIFTAFQNLGYIDANGYYIQNYVSDSNFYIYLPAPYSTYYSNINALLASKYHQTKVKISIGKNFNIKLDDNTQLVTIVSDSSSFVYNFTMRLNLGLYFAYNMPSYVNSHITYESTYFQILKFSGTASFLNQVLKDVILNCGQNIQVKPSFFIAGPSGQTINVTFPTDISPYFKMLPRPFFNPKYQFSVNRTLKYRHTEIFMPVDLFIDKENTTYGFRPTDSSCQLLSPQLNSTYAQNTLTIDPVIPTSSNNSNFVSSTYDFCIFVYRQETGVFSNFNFTIEFRKEKPYVNIPMQDQVDKTSFETGSTFVLTIDPLTFIDPDGDVLAYSFKLAGDTKAAEWIKFIASTNSLTGTPPYTMWAKYTFEVAATNGIFTVASQFTIQIKPSFAYILTLINTAVSILLSVLAGIRILPIAYNIFLANSYRFRKITYLVQGRLLTNSDFYPIAMTGHWRKEKKKF